MLLQTLENNTLYNKNKEKFGVATEQKAFQNDGNNLLHC